MDNNQLMTTRTITVELEFPDTETNLDDRYADAANAIWTILKAIAEPDRFEFQVHHDGSHSTLGDELNARWAEYGRDVRWE
ncbi:hypothetical protein CQZ88_02150 [Rhodococcus sp. ENV425]|nr:hypothetical protein CQZ88_02150 [Rhodococcus sp. ENV425]